MALAITLVKVITLAASLRRLEAKFGGVGGGRKWITELEILYLSLARRPFMQRCGVQYTRGAAVR